MVRKYALMIVLSLAIAILCLTRCTHELPADSGSVAAGKVPALASAGGNKVDQVPRGRLVRQPTIVAKALPLPPPGAPLKQTFPELQAHAKAGDADAASRLFQDTSLCARSRIFSEYISRSSDALLNQNLNGANPDKLKGTDAMLGLLQEQTAFVTKNSVLCSGVSDDEIASALPAALQSALLGDTLAADCYVGSNFAMVPGGMLSHPQWLTDYKDHSLNIAQQAIEQGDWTMVGLMQLAYGKQGNSLLSQVTGSDPLQYYRYLRLWRLGMKLKQDQDFIDGQLANAARALTPDQQNNADAWAQETYQRDFRANPDGANSSINSCPVDSP